MPNVDPDSVVFVSFTVETNDTAAQLRQYTEEQGFNWTFFVATPELLRALVAQFGNQITVPPSQPHFIIRPDGTTSDLMTGNPSPQSVINLLTQG